MIWTWAGEVGAMLDAGQGQSSVRAHAAALRCGPMPHGEQSTGEAVRIAGHPQPPAFRFAGSDLAFLLLPWLAALLLGTVVAQRVAVTGPAGFSLARATFFVANAASLTGFEMGWGWAVPTGMTATHATIWLIALAWSALLSVAIPTAAFAHVTGRRWSWRRIWAIAVCFLIGLALMHFLAGLMFGASLGTAAWDACAVSADAGLLTAERGPHNAVLWLVHFPIAALATLGPFILVDTIRAIRGHRAERITTATWAAVSFTFVFTVAMFVGPALIITGLAWLESSVARPGLSFAHAATAAIDARGSGFTDTVAALPSAGRWALIPIILLGGASGGVGGGLKAVTAGVLIVGVMRLARGGRAGTTFGMAAVWLIALSALFLMTFVALVAVLPQLPADRIALLAAGACANVGVSVDAVNAAGIDGHILAAAMLLGRALPWGVLWWSATRGDEPIVVG